MEGLLEFVCLLGFILIVGLIAIAITIKNIVYVCQPSEVLIFSGLVNKRPSGSIGYRVVKGGRTYRIPLFETVDRLDLTNMIIEITVKNAYSKGGIPLTVQGIANIKIPGELPLLHNTLERFLGRTREEIMEVGRETLEGNLRGVLATLTPEQVNRDKEAFASKLTEEAEHDLNRIGLVLDTLKIQNVSDDVGYLDAIGRMRSAQIRKTAQVAEASAQSSSAEVKWRNYMVGELSKVEAQMNIARKDNERRIADAQTKREAVIAEQVAQVQALKSQAQAEIGMQEARIEQVRLQLRADLIQPAEADKDAAVARAKANASKIVEQGKATSKVLSDLADAYRTSGTSGRDVLLMQKLVPLLDSVTSTIGNVHIDKITVLPGGGDSGSLGGSIAVANEQVRAATGVDLAAALKKKLGE